MTEPPDRDDTDPVSRFSDMDLMYSRPEVPGPFEGGSPAPYSAPGGYHGPVPRASNRAKVIIWLGAVIAVLLVVIILIVR